MPTLTGTLTDVTGDTLAPEDVLSVSVKAPVARVGTEIVTTKTVMVDVDDDGRISVDLDPGPAVLAVRAESSTDTFDLAVTGDMSTIREALIQDAGKLPELEQSELVQLAKQVREDAAFAASRADEAAVSESNAAKSEDEAQAASEAARNAQSDSEAAASAASDSEDAAKTSEDNAAESAQTATEKASAAKSSALSAADSEGTARRYRDEAGDSSSAAQTDRRTVQDIRDDLQTILDDSEAWAGFQEALEAMDDRIGAAVAEAVDKLKGDAPEAYDTLGEIAEWIADSEDEAAAMLQKIAEKADKNHRHGLDDLDDADTSAEPDTLVVRDGDGAATVAVPTSDGHAATKKYVDTEVAEHRPSIEDVTGLQDVLDGLEPRAWQGTQAEYDDLDDVDPDRTYYILEDD